MGDFFNQDVGQSIPWFGLTHILILVVFFLSLVLLWIFGPKLKDKKHEKWFRFTLLGLAIIFEWHVFESRMLNESIFRMPVCALALYGLFFAIAFKNEKIFKIAYFYAFGTILTYVFFDTLYGLDRWWGWTFFGAHACIGWFAVYGYRVLGYVPTKKDLYKSILFLAIYGVISGYATFRFGGSDNMFLLNPPVDFLRFLIDIHQIVYDVIFSLLAILLMYLMLLPISISERKKHKPT